MNNDDDDDVEFEEMQKAEKRFSFCVQIAFNCCLVTLMNIVVSSLIHFTNWNEIPIHRVHTLSLSFFAVSVLVVIVNFAMFYQFPSYYGPFRLAFKPKSFVSLNHFYSIVLAFVSSVILTVFLSAQFPFVSMIPFALLMVLTVSVKPFNKNAHNFRSFFGAFVCIVLVTFNVIAKEHEISVSIFVFVFFGIALLLFTVIFISVFLLLHSLKKEYEQSENSE